MSKRTWGLLGVLIALSVATYAMYREPPQKGVQVLDLSQLDPAQITKVGLIDAKGSLEMIREGDAWRVGEKWPADTTAVNALLNTLKQIRVSGAMTSRDARYDALGVTEAKATRVVLFVGTQEVASLMVGAAHEHGSYVRVGNNVYQVSRLRTSDVTLERSHWLDRRILRDTGKDAQSIHMTTTEGATLGLVKKDNAWALSDDVKLPEHFRLDTAIVNRYARSIVEIAAVDVPEDASQEALDALNTPALTITVKGNTAETKFTVAHGPEFSVARVENGLVYILDLVTAKGLLKTVEDFRNMAPLTFDGPQVNIFRFTEGKRHWSFKKDATGWVLESASESTPEGFVLASAKVDGRLRGLARLRGVGYAESTAVSIKPAVTFTLGQEGAADITLRCNAETKANDVLIRHCQGNSDDKIYQIEASRIGDLTAGLESFKTDPQEKPFEMNEQMLQQLPPDVRAQFLKQAREQQP